MNNKKKILFSLFFAVLLMTTSTGCKYFDSPPKSLTRSIFIMDTVAEITVYGDSDTAVSAVNAAFEELRTLEKVFSYTDANSELSRVNARAYGTPVQVSEYMGDLIERSLRLCEMTDGALDISLGMFIDLWSKEQVPDESEMAEILPRIGYEKIVYDDESRTVEFLDDAVKMHFGAVAKGYALDVAEKVLLEYGVASAIVDIGGEIAVIGESPRADGNWRIGVNNPHERSEIALVLHVKPGGRIATSGDSERFFTGENGEVYHHILDRGTGFPAVSDYSSVTVISHDGTFSDALATAIFAAGTVPQNQSFSEEYCVVCIDKKGEISASGFDNNDLCVGGDFVGGTSLD